MKLATCNVSDELRTELSLSKNCGWVSQTDGDLLFVDWLPTNSNADPNKLLKQVKMTEEFVKAKKPIILFDRYLSLSFKEQKFLKKSKAFFLEPAVNYRREFTYQPCWIDIPESYLKMSLDNFDREKNFDIGIIGSLKGKREELEKTVYNIFDTRDCRIAIEDLKMDNVENDFDIRDCKVTLLLTSEKENRIGYLNPYLNDYLKAGVIPMGGGRYFDSMIHHNKKDLFALIDGYHLTGFGEIWHIYEAIHNWYPEMRLENTAQNIAQIGEKLLK